MKKSKKASSRVTAPNQEASAAAAASKTASRRKAARSNEWRTSPSDSSRRARRPRSKGICRRADNDARRSGTLASVETSPLGSS
jgi:hypothetical protein